MPESQAPDEAPDSSDDQAHQADGSPGEPAEAEKLEPIEPDASDIGSAVVMGVLFVGTILLSVAFASLFGPEQQVFEDPQDPTNPLIYLVLVIVFTAAILLIAKLGLQKIIQYVILGAVFLTMAYVYDPLLALIIPGSVAVWVALGIATALTAALYYYPEWYVVDAAGVSVAAGATGLFGISFGLIPALVLLIGFAIYDAIAVYQTEHMLDLADEVMGLRLPIMLVVPKKRGYSFLEGDEIRSRAPDDEETGQPSGSDAPDHEDREEGQTSETEPQDTDSDAEAPDDGSRDALFMGLGDIVIPGVLVVSAINFLCGAGGQCAHPPAVDTVLGLAPPVFVAATTLIGATVGFAFLMRSVLKGTPHAGLPALNGGALTGFLIPVLWLYGFGPLIPVL